MANSILQRIGDFAAATALAIAILLVVLFIAVVLEYLGILQLIPIILIFLLAASGVY